MHACQNQKIQNQTQPLIALFLQDLLLSRVLILSGIPHLPTGTAVMFLELGWSTPRGQVRHFLFLMPLGLKVEGQSQAATTLIELV